MAGDSADASLLTSAIEEDPTESPNLECPERSEIHPYDRPRIEDDDTRKCGKDQSAVLLPDFDDIIDYIDCCSSFQNWLSRICSKSEARIFFPLTLHLCPYITIDQCGEWYNGSDDNDIIKRERRFSFAARWLWLRLLYQTTCLAMHSLLKISWNAITRSKRQTLSLCDSRREKSIIIVSNCSKLYFASRLSGVEERTMVRVPSRTLYARDGA